MRRFLRNLPLLLLFAVTARGFEVSDPEGNSLRFVEVVMTTAGGSNFAITGQYQTVDGTATAADGDYLPASGTFTIAPGETTSTAIRIGIVGDTKFEATESFLLVIANVQGGTIDDPGPHTFTLENDDAPPALVVDPASVVEGNSGTTTLIFTARLTAAAGTPVTAAYATANGTATAPSDYLPAQGSVVFAPGQTTRTIAVTVNSDTLFEPDETLSLIVTRTGVAPVTGTGTIVNDDEAPASSLSIVSGNNQQARLGAPLPQPLVVRVTNDAGAGVRNATVQWVVTRGSATVDPATSTTNADGRAQTNVTALNSVGVIEVQARVAGLPSVTFTINALTSFEARARGPVAVPVARVLDGICARNENEFAEACRALALLGDDELTPALERVAPQQSGAQAKIASEIANNVAGSIAARLSAVRGGVGRFSAQQLQVAVNGRPLPLFALASAFLPQEATDAGGAEESPYNGWSAFVSGSLGTGERDEQDGALGFTLDSRGLMFGADRLFGQTIAGASLHLLQLDSELDGGVGSVDTSGWSLSLYGSRGGLFAGSNPDARFDGMHLDGSITYGRNTYESEHDVAISGLPLSEATSENSADVFALSAGTGFEAHSGRTDLDVSLSATWSRASIDDLTESGNGPLILFVQGQDVESLTGNLGLNLRAAFAMPFGTLLPHLRGELVHEFKDDARLVTARFLRDRLGATFTVPLDRVDANYGRVGAGVQAVFPFGWSASLDATQDVLRDDLQFRSVQFNVYKSF